MDAHLLEYVNARNLVKDLAAFKSIVGGDKEGTSKSKSSKKPAKSGKSSRVTKVSPAVTDFLTAVEWTEDHFREEYKTIFDLMRSGDFTRDHRLSDHRGTRLLCVSGVPWNRGSHNRRRDWAVTALAVTVESALVEQYRRRLLDMCPSACHLRKDLQSLFVDLAIPVRVDRPEANKSDLLYEWQFADNVKIPDSEVPVVHNLKDFLEPWQRACSTLAKDVKVPVLTLIQSLEKIVLGSFPSLHQPSSGPRDLSTPPPGQGPPTHTWPPSESPGGPLADDEVNFPDSPIHPASSLSSVDDGSPLTSNLDDDKIVDPPSPSLPRIRHLPPRRTGPPPRGGPTPEANKVSLSTQVRLVIIQAPSIQSKKPSKPRPKPGSSKLTPLPDDVYETAL
ncbi:hypothetical protein EDB89DRAFT_2079529 [Lactarius sanguifluus]|nr:hypothetical protein EDB89DRAFT_2079529 [Lactarius sanguifluus]